MPEWANCVECGQAREKRALNENGVCRWCLLTVIQNQPNPFLPECR